MYQKEIIYLGLFHHDSREKNAGYLKVSGSDNIFRLELQVKNLPGAVTGSFPIRLQSETGWREADALVLKEGNGKWSGSAAENILRAEIILSDEKRIRGESKSAAAEERLSEVQEPAGEIPQAFEVREAAETERRAGEVRTAETAENTEAIEASRRVNRDRTLDRTETGRRADRIGTPDRAGMAGREDMIETGRRTTKREETARREERPGIEETERRKEAARITGAEEKVKTVDLIKAERRPARPEHTPLYENKWEQLLTTYEQIHPYGDNRIYIKLAPKDFIVLRENYQHLVNNSFLLHGFYNYRYLILGKEKDFYLGVPGVFYEREKMVALMFGFEAFECEGGEAEEGRFGYYLRKVEL